MTDKWHGLTMEDIRAIEEATKRELDEVIKGNGYTILCILMDSSFWFDTTNLG